jgi:hypothetical protein
MKLNTTEINAAIAIALKSAGVSDVARATYADKVIELKGLFGGADREIVKAYVCPIAAKQYKAEYVDGTWTDSDCAAKRYSNRLILKIVGKGESAKVAINKALVKQVTAMLKGMEPKVLNATIAAVKAALK